MHTIWEAFLKEQMKLPKIQQLNKFILEERKTKKIYPKSEEVMNAFKLTPFNKLKVVILGQDPYHTTFTAHGLAFSSLQATRPPSLQNIFVEVHKDYFAGQEDHNTFKSNNLTEWAEQGVLLLNTVLTVEEGKAGSHKDKGWELFIINLMDLLNDYPQPLVFMLWGKHAQEYGLKIKNKKHIILKAAHPAAEIYKPNAGFFGCKHFSQANHFIKNSRKWTPDGNNMEINWGVWN